MRQTIIDYLIFENEEKIYISSYIIIIIRISQRGEVLVRMVKYLVYKKSGSLRKLHSLARSFRKMKAP